MTQEYEKEILDTLRSIDARLEHLVRFANAVCVQKFELPHVPPPEPLTPRPGLVGR
jgi:hypothetical protein